MDSQFLSEIEKNIGSKRFDHSIRVGELAKKLANIYKISPDKAYTAGLLHDCGKFQDKDQLLKKAQDFGIILDETMINNIDLIHADLGAKIAYNNYNIRDKDILHAIRYHTTGRKGMTTLEKLIFISDYMEPKRNFNGLEKVRELAYTDLDASIVLAIDQNIKFLIDRKKLISTNSIEARNFLMMERES